jgi:protein gp37
VNSMSDLFQPGVPVDYIAKVAEVMIRAPWHTFQVLTKRASHMADLLNGSLAFAAAEPHIWWGVSVENRKHGIPRIAQLQGTKARVRFLSIEPLLEDIGKIDLKGIHWVIVGGESGHGARPMNPNWVASLKLQCAKEGVPFFFKQWGGRQKSKAGRLLEGRTHDEMPIQAPLYSIQLNSREFENRAV